MGFECETCQACNRPQLLKTKVAYSPIPPKLMVSVALDIFRMPEVILHGKKYESMAICVDRHSGWVVAVPRQNRGLRGMNIAQTMIEWQWRPFGVPTLIESDKGRHFVGAW